MPLHVSSTVALAAALALSASAHGASLTFLEADLAPSRYPTLLSPDGTLITGTWVDPGGVSDTEGTRWTLSGGTWTRSPAAGVQHPDQDLAFTHNGLARTNELVYSQRAGGELGVWRSAGGAPGGTQVPLPPSADPGCNPQYSFDTDAQISADGTAITAPTPCGVYRWTAATGSAFITPVGVEGVLRISDDGRTVAGQDGFVWTEAGGYMPLSITLAGLAALSGDGSTIGGGAVVAGQILPMVWDALRGATFLGDLPSGDRTRRVVDLSEDGSVAVGAASFGGFEQAFAWTREEGAVGLGRRSRPIAMTPDGKLVVGELLDVAQRGDRVFVWNLETGVMRTLGEILADFGIEDAPGAGLYSPVGISDDGMTIAGTGGLAGFTSSGGGIYVGAWVAVIPEPGTAALVALGVAGLARFRNGAQRG